MLPFEMNACLPGCVWNATPRSLSPLERNIPFLVQTCVPVIDQTSEPLSGAPAWFYMGCAKGDKTEWVDLEPWVRCGDFCICLFLEYAMVHRLLFPWDAFKRAVSDVLMSWNLFLQQMFQQIVSLLPPLQQVFLTE